MFTASVISNNVQHTVYEPYTGGACRHGAVRSWWVQPGRRELALTMLKKRKRRIGAGASQETAHRQASPGSKRQQEALRGTMRQMLHLRDEELRGIARRLNTLNQYHAAVILNLDRLTRPETGPVDAAALATGSLQALQRCTADLHRLAEVLHPQALEQSGF